MSAPARPLPAYRLDDGERRHAANPDRFEIPSREEREGLEPGAFAKLIFLDDLTEAGERMWVKVTDRTADGYRGTLANQPAVLPMAFGDPMTFEPAHVIDIYRGGEL